MARKIVITSGKGGVGKTSLTANLGYNLAVMGKRVLVIDVDFGLNNLDVVMGIEQQVVYDIVDCIEGKCRVKQALVESATQKNLFVLPASHTFTKSKITYQDIQNIFDDIDGSFDYIFLDCPAGIDGGFHRAVSVCDDAIVVTTPQLSSLRDADKVIAILRSYDMQSINVVVNRIRGDLVIDGLMLSPEEIENILKSTLLGVIPEDDGVFLYNAGSIPYDKNSYQAFRLIAKNLITGKYKLFNYAKDYKGIWGAIKRSIRKNI